MYIMFLKGSDFMNPKEDRVQKRIRISPDTYMTAEYYAEKKSIPTNEFIVDAIELAIRHENKDYDLPTMEQARLNELNDRITMLSNTVEQLNHIITHGFDSLLNLTRGDSYLLDENERGDN